MHCSFKFCPIIRHFYQHSILSMGYWQPNLYLITTVPASLTTSPQILFCEMRLSSQCRLEPAVIQVRCFPYFMKELIQLNPQRKATLVTMDSSICNLDADVSLYAYQLHQRFHYEPKRLAPSCIAQFYT